MKGICVLVIPSRLYIIYVCSFAMTTTGSSNRSNNQMIMKNLMMMELGFARTLDDACDSERFEEMISELGVLVDLRSTNLTIVITSRISTNEIKKGLTTTGVLINELGDIMYKLTYDDQFFTLLGAIHEFIPIHIH